MSLGAYIAGGIALKALHEALSNSDADHDDVLERTFEAVERQTAETTDIYVDHINDRVDADGNTREATPGSDHIPDLVVSGFADRNLVVEVETDGSLNGDAGSQLVDFSTSSYTRVLVVPEGVVEDGAQFLDGIDADTENVVVSDSSSITNLL